MKQKLKCYFLLTLSNACKFKKFWAIHRVYCSSGPFIKYVNSCNFRIFDSSFSLKVFYISFRRVPYSLSLRLLPTSNQSPNYLHLPNLAARKPAVDVLEQPKLGCFNQHGYPKMGKRALITDQKCEVFAFCALISLAL